MDLIVAIFIFFVVGPIIAAKITFRNIRNDIECGRIKRVSESAFRERCSHESAKWVDRVGLENIGIQARICETCGMEIEMRVAYLDDKGNILRTRKM